MSGTKNKSKLLLKLEMLVLNNNPSSTKNKNNDIKANKNFTLRCKLYSTTNLLSNILIVSSGRKELHNKQSLLLGVNLTIFFVPFVFLETIYV